MLLLTHLAKLQADLFMDDNERYMRCLPVLKVPKDILSGCYEILVEQNKLIRIEDIPTKDKNNIFETAKEFANGRIKNKESIIQLCKCLYCLEFLLSK